MGEKKRMVTVIDREQRQERAGWKARFYRVFGACSVN